MKKSVVLFLALLFLICGCSKEKPQYQIYSLGQTDGSQPIFEIIPLYEDYAKLNVKQEINVTFAGQNYAAELSTGLRQIGSDLQPWVSYHTSDSVLLHVNPLTNEVISIMNLPSDDSKKEILSIDDCRKTADKLVQAKADLSRFEVKAEEQEEYYRFEYTGKINGIQTVESIIIRFYKNGCLRSYGESVVDIFNNTSHTNTDKSILSSCEKFLETELLSINKQILYEIESQKLTATPDGKLAVHYTFTTTHTRGLQEAVVVLSN